MQYLDVLFSSILCMTSATNTNRQNVLSGRHMDVFCLDPNELEKIENGAQRT